MFVILSLLQNQPNYIQFIDRLTLQAEPRHCAQLGLAYVAKVEEDESVAFMGEVPAPWKEEYNTCQCIML